MFRRLMGHLIFLVLGAVISAAAPAAAQIIESAPQPMPFPVLAGDTFHVNPHTELANPMFRLAAGALELRSTPAGWVDMEAYCRIPERHWGPVSMINCSLEVSGSVPASGFALPSHVPLRDLPMGSTVTLRMLVQAPLIVLDLQGNPTVVLDTFLEEYHWTLDDSRDALAGSLPSIEDSQ